MMRTGTLEYIIAKKITAGGPIPFHQFMEMALYYPGLGYYTSGRNRIGETGDYFTSVWFCNLFGEMIARQLVEMWSLMEQPSLTIVEFGGDNGKLCSDILNELKFEQALFRNLQYYMVEKGNPAFKTSDPDHIEKVKRVESLDQLPVITHGCIISNELVDNFPVSRVQMEDELMEIYVDYQDGFVEKLLPASSLLKDYFEHLNIRLPKGYQAEVNLQAIQWLRDISLKLQQGFVLTIDYGSLSAELYQPRHRMGTILCYRQHQVHDSFYTDIGEQDITSHVNFSALLHWGEKHGLDCCGYTDQANFLMSLGLADHLKKKEARLPNHKVSGLAKQAVMISSFLSGMGRKFKVLIQNKGIKKPQLSGLRLCFPICKT